MKTCSQCEITKSFLDFNKCKKHLDGFRFECRSCQKKNSKIYRSTPEFKETQRIKSNIWYHNNKEAALEATMKSKYGITVGEYTEMKVKQHFCCKVCQIHESKLLRRLVIDHCHKTGKIRGLLCDRCNRVLGSIKDDPLLCDKLREYLNNTSNDSCC